MFSTILLAYNNPFTIYEPDIGKMVSLIFGALILCAFYYSSSKLDRNLINFVVLVYFIFTILLLIFTEPMILVQNMVIRNTNSTEFSYRGVGTLCTEPGLFGGVLIFLLLVIDYLKRELKITKFNQYLLYVLIIFMLLMTKSGTGYLYFTIFLVFKFFESKIPIQTKSIILSISVFTIFSFLGYISQVDTSNLGRGFVILSQLSNPAELAENDSSFFVRIVDVVLALNSVLYYPIGVGNGDVASGSYNVMMNIPFIKSFYRGETFGLNSSFAFLTVSYGFIFWIYLCILYFRFSKSSLSCKFFSFLFLAVSYSSAFPAIWLLLALNIIERSTMTTSNVNIHNATDK